MQSFYYPRVSRRILIALLDMFNRFKVYNYSKTGQVVKIIDVPLKFGPSEKYHLFNLQTESGKKYYPKLPAILMSLESIKYNSDRATSVNELRQFYNPSIDIGLQEEFWSDVQPSPYDYSFQLKIKTESIDHLLQIFENILPYFNPSNHLRIKEFEFLNLERDLMVKLDDVNMEYPQEMSEEESRYFDGTISFTVHGYMYRKIDTSKIIKYIKTNYIYSPYSSEQYSTSGVPTSAAPSDYTFMQVIDSINNAYTKVTNEIAPNYVSSYPLLDELGDPISLEEE